MSPCLGITSTCSVSLPKYEPADWRQRGPFAKPGGSGKAIYFMTPEQVRLNEAREQKQAWKKWGPYLSERQWGTVREEAVSFDLATEDSGGS